MCVCFYVCQRTYVHACTIHTHLDMCVFIAMCEHVELGRGNGLVCMDNSVAIRLQHLPSGVFSPGIPNGAGDASISAFTLLNMTFERACTRKKKKEKNLCVHARTQTHTSQRLCESQNAEPEGCCVSDVCIVYSVVPVHVGDCCALRPHSRLVLFTMTGVDSRLLSRRAERPRKERKKKGGRDRRRQKEIIDYIFFPYSLFTYCFSLFCSWSLILSPQTSAPMGHQLSDSQRRVPPLFLSSLLSLFAVWDTHRFAPGESIGNPR